EERVVTRRLALVLALALASGFVRAQAPPARAAQGPAPTAEERREDIFKMIDAYVISNLQESLGLSDEQFVKLLPLVKRLQGDRRSFVVRRQQTLNQLGRLLNSGTATEPRVVELLKELKTIESDEPAQIRRDADAIDATLTPLQQAKYRVLELQLERRMRELLNQVRKDAAANATNTARQRRQGEPQQR